MNEVALTGGAGASEEICALRPPDGCTLQLPAQSLAWDPRDTALIEE